MDTKDEHTEHTEKSQRTEPSGPAARSYTAGRFTVVELRGEIDLLAAGHIRECTDAATAPQGARVIVDLRPATFIDCAALGLLCRARRRVLDRGGSIDLVCTRALHLRMLRVTGLAGYFPSSPTVAEISA
ncbi:STAS domain-containing protein [Streptomyces sp. NPDC090052]|uniref:STAS domain-containing protein n=1 Tax=unclassified Streptomyces TaxID=2593676 RepID=UPI002255BE53|nr:MULTISPECIES: STAS domain-containing protein [unclassified Streptomyces]MCX4724117.1 STAS domain-containing protein [Streptomyces sp. NBC_01306]WSV06338.1 STAS domain-containing protein [Streptomyces sp. NBC_01020]WSX44469.1 STAS domain-containing protein [Streptomyces sp. NBC_00963]WSX67530.1 STAS domain-containing protein [Streptomyces sp. NBC_00932]